MSRILRLAAFALLALLLAGCPKKTNPPRPSDTVLGGRSGNSPDWIDSTDIYGEDASGLLSRSGSGFGEDGERFENILADIYFDYDTSFVKESERPKLVQAADHLQQNPNDRLLIEGNADWRGTTEYNMALGDRRANSVKQYLITLGIDPDRIQTVSHGDLNAIENAAESQMAEDRRADMVIIR